MSFNTYYSSSCPTWRNRSIEGLDLAENGANTVNPPNVNIFPPPNWQREDVNTGNSSAATVYRAPGIQITTSRFTRPQTTRTQNINITSQPGDLVMISENPFHASTGTRTETYSPLVGQAINMGFSIGQIESAMSRQILREGQVHLTIDSLIDDIMTHTEEASPRRRSVNASNQPSSFVPEARVESIEEAPSSSQHESERVGLSRCIVCNSEPVEILFLPCAHLATCSFCSPLLEFCPACKAQIKRWIKVKQVDEY